MIAKTLDEVKYVSQSTEAKAMERRMLLKTRGTGKQFSYHLSSSQPRMLKRKNTEYKVRTLKKIKDCIILLKESIK